MLEKLSETSPNGRVVDFISDPDTDVQVGITISDKNKRIVTVFRGSESKSDWMYDFMIYKSRLYPEHYDECCVHTGFLKQLHTNDVYLKILKTSIYVKYYMVATECCIFIFSTSSISSCCCEFKTPTQAEGLS